MTSPVTPPRSIKQGPSEAPGAPAQTAQIVQTQVTLDRVGSSRRSVSFAESSISQAQSQSVKYADLPGNFGRTAPSCFATICTNIGRFFSNLINWINSFGRYDPDADLAPNPDLCAINSFGRYDPDADPVPNADLCAYNPD